MSSLHTVMKEKNKPPVELLTAEKAKKAYYLTQKLPEQVSTCGGHTFPDFSLSGKVIGSLALLFFFGLGIVWNLTDWASRIFHLEN